MSGVDPALRRAHFHFGAGSGGTSLLVLYPQQEITFAILANLGHARFPMDKLMRVAGSFQYNPANIIFNVWLGAVIAFIGFKVMKKLKQKRNVL
jgi:hypothetical protein